MKKPFNALFAMALTGFVRACGENVGGGLRLYLIEAADAGAFTLGVGSEYASTTPNATAVYKEYEFKEDTLNFEETVQTENGVTSVNKTVTFYVDKMDQLSRDMVEEIKAASLCGLVAIIEDNNNEFWVVGYSERFGVRRPLRLADGTVSQLGTALTDQNGRTIVLACQDAEHSRTFTGTVPV